MKQLFTKKSAKNFRFLYNETPSYDDHAYLAEREYKVADGGELVEKGFTDAQKDQNENRRQQISKTIDNFVAKNKEMRNLTAAERDQLFKLQTYRGDTVGAYGAKMKADLKIDDGGKGLSGNAESGEFKNYLIAVDQELKSILAERKKINAQRKYQAARNEIEAMVSKLSEGAFDKIEEGINSNRNKINGRPDILWGGDDDDAWVYAKGGELKLSEWGIDDTLFEYPGYDKLSPNQKKAIDQELIKIAKKFEEKRDIFYNAFSKGVLAKADLPAPQPAEVVTAKANESNEAENKAKQAVETAFGELTLPEGFTAKDDTGNRKADNELYFGKRIFDKDGAQVASLWHYPNKADGDNWSFLSQDMKVINYMDQTQAAQNVAVVLDPFGKTLDEVIVTHNPMEKWQQSAQRYATLEEGFDEKLQEEINNAEPTGLENLGYELDENMLKVAKFQQYAKDNSFDLQGKNGGVDGMFGSGTEGIMFGKGSVKDAWYAKNNSETKTIKSVPLVAGTENLSQIQNRLQEIDIQPETDIGIPVFDVNDFYKKPFLGKKKVNKRKVEKFLAANEGFDKDTFNQFLETNLNESFTEPVTAEKLFTMVTTAQNPSSVATVNDGSSQSGTV